MNGLELYDRGREAFERGEYELALALLRESWDDTIHFKTISRIGEVLCRLGRHREAVTPLAAATSLNRGSLSPCLLAEALLQIGELQLAQDAATESLRRTPGYRRAQAVLNEIDQRVAGTMEP